MEWFIYLLKVSACTGLFFLLYHFLLSKFTFFSLNRWYLIGSLVLSFIIPALTIEVKSEVYSQAPILQQNEIGIAEGTINELDSEVNFSDTSTTDSFERDEFLMGFYLLVITILFLKLLIGIVRILWTVRNYKTNTDSNFIQVPSDNHFKNSSFYTYLFIDENLSVEDKEQVIKHEQVHIQSFHFVDKLIANLSVCIMWFNPIAYVYLNAIDANHEFEADAKRTLKTDKSTYASLILNLSQNSNQLIINHFSKLPLKKRMMMLFKNPTIPMRKVAYLTIFPIVAICCLAFVNQKEVIVYIKSSSLNIPPQKENVEEITTLKIDKEVPQTKKVITQMKEEESRNITEISSNLQEKVNVRLQSSTLVNVNPFKKLTSLGVLVIDAGHGGKDDASKSITGLREKNMNLRVALILKEEAEKRNIKVVMTREKDEFLSLADRVTYQGGADAFISIHHNTMPQKKDGTPVFNYGFRGFEVYYTKESKVEKSKDLGLNILKSLKIMKDYPVRDSLKSQSLFVTREAKIPSVVVEMGNLSYQDSFDFINEEKNIRRICNLILDGYTKFLNS